MRKSKVIVYDEIEKAKKIYDEGFVLFNFEEMALFAKYCRFISIPFGKIKRELRNLLGSHFYSENRREGIIEAAIKVSRHYKLVGNDMDITITKKELAIIRSLPERFGKILFVMLAVAKKDKYDNAKIVKNRTDNLIGLFYNRGLRSAIKTAGVRLKRAEYDAFRYELDGKLGYIGSTYGSEDNWRICFAEEGSGEIAITVKDMNLLMEYFPYYCEECGEKIEKSNNRKALCANCASNRHKESKRLSAQKIRSEK